MLYYCREINMTNELTLDSTRERLQRRRTNDLRRSSCSSSELGPLEHNGTRQGEMEKLPVVARVPRWSTRRDGGGGVERRWRWLIKMKWQCGSVVVGGAVCRVQPNSKFLDSVPPRSTKHHVPTGPVKWYQICLLGNYKTHTFVWPTACHYIFEIRIQINSKISQWRLVQKIN